MTIQEFAQRQSLPYAAKIAHAEIKAREFYEHCENVHVSVGGLDSITLLIFLRTLGIECPAISVSCLEDVSIQKVHRALGVTPIKPYRTQEQVIKEFGFPVISKAKASKIEKLQAPNAEKQTFIHAIMTGEMGAQGHYGYSKKLKLPDKWIQRFGGNYADMRPDLTCEAAPFKVSARCCYWMKEKPCDDWAKEHHSYPYLGLMASEGGQREMGLMKNGCNYYGKYTTRSAPFAIFSRQDLLRLAVELCVPVPAIYGEIVQEDDGTLRTTRAQRTGCYLCGFGIHVEKRPHRFDRMYEDNPKLWNHVMRDVGWGKVLDYIGVGWRQPYHPDEIDWQLEMEDLNGVDCD